MDSFQDILVEARKNKLSAVWTSLTDAEVLRIWVTIAGVVRHNLVILRRGVVIPGLLTVTLSRVSLDISGSKVLVLQRPVCSINEKLASTHQLQTNERPVSGGFCDVVVVPLNLTQVARDAELERDQVHSAVKEIAGAVTRLLAARRPVELYLDGIGILRLNNRRVKMRFFRGFVNSVDGSGRSKKISTSRPGTTDSLLSQDDWISRRHVSFIPNSAVLPDILEIHRNEDHVKQADFDSMTEEKNINDEYFTRVNDNNNYFDNQMGEFESIENVDELNGLNDNIEEVNILNLDAASSADSSLDSSVEMKRNDYTVADDVTRTLDVNSIKDADCQQSTNNVWPRTTENRMPLNMSIATACCVKHPNELQCDSYQQNGCDLEHSDSNNTTRMASQYHQLTNGNNQPAEYLKNFRYPDNLVNAHQTQTYNEAEYRDVSGLFSTEFEKSFGPTFERSHTSLTERNNAGRYSLSSDAMNAAREYEAMTFRPTRGNINSSLSRSSSSLITGRLSVPSLRPHRSLSLSSRGSSSSHSFYSDDKLPATSRTSLTACNHANSGQELCYICHQRAHRNVAVSYAEERKKQEEVEDRALFELQKARNEIERLKLEELKKNQRSAAALLAEFNLETAMRAEEAKQNKENGFYPSLVFYKRLRTPPAFIKRDQYKSALDLQLNEKRYIEEKVRRDRALAEQMEQTRSAEELAAEREAVYRQKCARREEYRRALAAQINQRPPNMDDYTTELPYFGRTKPTEEFLNKKREQMRELYQCQYKAAQMAKLDELEKLSEQRRRDEEVLSEAKRRLSEENRLWSETNLRCREELRKSWVEAMEHKYTRDLEMRARDRQPCCLLLDQCDRYKRCKQCKRRLSNVGTSNLMQRSRTML